MHRLTVDIAQTDTARRLVEGIAVPYGEIADLGICRVRFAPGSIRRARNSTPLLLGHDTNQPVGILSSLADTEEGARMAARIDRTPDGDRALEQARSGSRSGLSIGFEIQDYADAGEGVWDVTAADVYEISLVAVPAFAGATIDRVAAQLDTEPAPDEDEGEGEEEEQEQDDGESADTEQEDQQMEIQASGAAILVAERPRRELSAGEFVALSIRAQHGEQEAARLLTAALTESISTDVSGLLPPTYERQVIGGKEVNRPLYTAFRSRPLPGVGLQVNKPAWTTPPDGAWAADVNADATSTKVVIGSQSAVVLRWDWAGAIPWVVVQRSDPSMVDEIYAEAVQDFYLDVEAKVYGELGAAAPGVATTLGAAIAEFYVATGNQRSPEVIIMAPDVWGKFADAGALNVALLQGSVSATGDLTSSFAGIPAVTSGTLPAGETILATRRAVDARTTEPVRLTANAIGALNVELAVVGEGLFDTDHPSELLKFAAVIPTMADRATAGRK